MPRNLMRGLLPAWICVAGLCLAGCRSGASVNSGTSSACTSCTVGGTVSGLDADENVTLQNNGDDTLSILANGTFTFSPSQTAGSAYDVTVQSHSPGITCPLTNGSGMVGASNVTDIVVACTGGTATVLHAFAGGTTDGQYPNGALVRDSAGNLYGTSAGGGADGEGMVFKISPTGTETVVYSFAGGTTDGAGPLAGVATDSAGNLYGMTSSGGRDDAGTVFKISTTGTETVLYSFTGSTSEEPYPIGGLVVDSAGNLYGATNRGGANDDGAVFRISATGTETILHSFANLATDGAFPVGSLAMDSGGDLYGTTLGGGNGLGTVFKVSVDGTEAVLYSFAGGTADGRFPNGGLILDSAGNMYGTTSAGGPNDDGTVFKISAAGAETLLHSFAGGTTDGANPAAGLSIDSAGNIYGTTPGGGANSAGTMFKISTTGTETVLYSFGAGPDDGSGPHTALKMDSAGNLYGTTLGGGASGIGTVFELE